MDLGPCFGMNGHFRRDPDVISRLSKSTIDFVSVCIGFGSLSSAKMVVLNEILTLVRFVIRKMIIFFCYFDPGIILGLLSY